MPMLYGEGSKAFVRLQEEIMRSSDDQTLFAWQDNALVSRGLHQHGLLASAPLAFAHSGDLVPFASPLAASAGAASTGTHTTHVMTNKGPHIELNVGTTHLQELPDSTRSGLAAILECTRENQMGYFGIALEPTEESAIHFVRTHINKLFHLEQPAASKRLLYVRQGAAGPKRAAAPFHHLVYLGLGRTDIAYAYDRIPSAHAKLGNPQAMGRFDFMRTMSDASFTRST